MRVAVLGSGTTSLELPAHLAAIRSASTAIDIVNPRLVVFPATPYERLIVDLGYLDAAEQAQRAGFAAVVINSFADYGIDAARAAGIVMLGSGEAALRAAAAAGPRFSIVTIWPRSMAHLYDERLRALGLTERCARVRHVGTEADLTTLGSDDSVMSQLHRGDAAMLRRVLAECRAAIAQDDIQSIVLGCTCMAPIAATVAAELDFPVMEGSGLAVRAAIAMPQPGATPGAQTMSAQRAGATSAGALVDAWLGLRQRNQPINQASDDRPDVDCDVCVP